MIKPGNVTPFDFSGLMIRDLTPDSLDSASVAQIHLAPGTAHPKAKSIRSDKLYVGVEGRVIFDTEDGKVDLEPMDLLLIRKDEWFEYHNAGDGPAALLLIHVPSFQLESEVFHS